ncbi:SapB/AmfS family lanthipeptide [Streptomyces sp. NPDC057403]
MSLLELQGLTIESQDGLRPPPGSRASKACRSAFSILCNVF